MHRIDLTYDFEEVRYYKRRIVQVIHNITYDYTVEIELEDIAHYFVLNAMSTKEDFENAMKVLNQLETYDCLDYEQMELDKDFIDYLKDKHKDDALYQLECDLEDDE